MKFNEIVESEELSAVEKLSKIAELVKEVRAKYGNLDAELPEAEVCTVDGNTPMSLLDVESKVALAKAAFSSLVRDAYEDTVDQEGIVIDRRIEEYIATSPVLNNLTTTTGSDYL